MNQQYQAVSAMSMYLCLLFFGLAAAGPLSKNVPIPVSVPELEELRNFLETMDGLKGDDTIITATINNFTDLILANIDAYMSKQKFDPMAMPDISEKFSKFMVSGEFTLSQGVMTDASTLHRVGNSVVSYNESSKYLTIVVPMGFTDLKFQYNYKVKFMHIGPSGLVDGGVTKMGMKVVIGIDYNTFMASLDKYEITNSGHISIQYHGNIIYDWLITIMSNMTTMALKPIFLKLVETIVAGTLRNVIKNINAIVQGILNSSQGINLASSLLEGLVF